ncbi:MAG: hypothetical protein U0840_28365 [Gemmataceae bacterium]
MTDHIPLGQLVVHLHRQQPGRIFTDLGPQERHERGHHLVINRLPAIRHGLDVDAADRLVTQTDPLGQVTTLTYDAAHRLTERTDRLGRIRAFSYDAANRVTAETWTDAAGQPAGSLSWSYDAVGNRLSATSAAGSATYTYDALDRVSTQTGPWGQTRTFTYDAVGQRILVQDSLGGSDTSTYDAAGLLPQPRRQHRALLRRRRAVAVATGQGAMAING